MPRQNGLQSFLDANLTNILYLIYSNLPLYSWHSPFICGNRLNTRF
nr:MAG TPA: hypothetical protein [Caudoviricetes sp.]